MEQQLKTLLGVAAVVYAFFAWRATQREQTSVTQFPRDVPHEVGSTNLPVMSMHWVPSAWDSPRLRVILAVWTDGRIVWSTNRFPPLTTSAGNGRTTGLRECWGGPPYFEANVGRTNVERLLGRAATNSYLRAGVGAGIGFMMPDASYHVVNILRPEGRCRLALSDCIVFPQSPDLNPSESDRQWSENLNGAWGFALEELPRLIPTSGGVPVRLKFRFR